MYYLHMYERMYGCMHALIEIIPAFVRALWHECACVFARAAGAAAQHERATARCDSPCGYVYV